MKARRSCNPHHRFDPGAGTCLAPHAQAKLTELRERMQRQGSWDPHRHGGRWAIPQGCFVRAGVAQPDQGGSGASASGQAGMQEESSSGCLWGCCERSTPATHACAQEKLPSSQHAHAATPAAARRTYAQTCTSCAASARRGGGTLKRPTRCGRSRSTGAQSSRCGGGGGGAKGKGQGM